jgi:mannose-6-phosphate isomerase-like protein (cupin superfamily)
MRQIFLPLLILALASDRAAAQRADSTPSRTRGSAARPAGPARRAPERMRRRPDYIDATGLREELRWLDGRRYMGTTLLTSSDEQTTYLLIVRRSSSQPEVHARWDDLVIVRSGTGAIELGDSLAGSRYRAPGEREGGRIVAPYQFVLHAGDIVRIPAAVPHAFIVSGTAPLEYLVIKQRRRELPIRWTGER